MDADSPVLQRTESNAAAKLHRQRLAAYRYLALLCVFDLIGVVTAWALLCQTTEGSSFSTALTDSIVKFTFSSSLFDVVALAAVRTTILLAVYWVNWYSSAWVVAMTTVLSTLAMIAKVTYYQFENGRHPIDYVLFVAGFLVPWLEATLYILAISPLHRKLELFYSRCTVSNPDDSVAFSAQDDSQVVDIPPYDMSFDDALESYMPAESWHNPEEDHYDSAAEEMYFSEPESEAFRTPRAGSPTGSGSPSINSAEGDWMNTEVIDRLRHLSPVDIQYIRSGSDALQETWENALTTWDFVSSKNGVQIASRTIADRKVFKSEGLVYGSPQSVFKLIRDNYGAQPEWNQQLKHTEILQHIDTYTDIIYTVVAEQSGGLMACRDFVDVRRWKMQAGNYVVAMTGATHLSQPPKKKYVRGSHGHSGFVILSVDGQPNVTNLFWVLDVDMNLTKWLPNRIVEQTTCSMLTSFHESVRNALESKAKQKLTKSAHYV